MQGEGDCSDGSLFSLRCDWHSWCRPAPCLPHTGFHNEWPGMDTTRSPPPALLVGTAWLDFMGWSQRRAAHSRVMPSTGPSLPRVTTFCFWFDSIELLSGCIICKICMMWGTEGTWRYLFKPSRCPVAELRVAKKPERRHSRGISGHRHPGLYRGLKLPHAAAHFKLNVTKFLKRFSFVFFGLTRHSQE